MNPNTGEIEQVKDEAEARKKGLVPIPAEELARVKRMSKRNRRRWALKHLKKEAAANSSQAVRDVFGPKPSPTSSNAYEDQAERNAVKRLRKTRLRPKSLRKGK